MPDYPQMFLKEIFVYKCIRHLSLLDTYTITEEYPEKKQRIKGLVILNTVR